MVRIHWEHLHQHFFFFGLMESSCFELSNLCSLFNRMIYYACRFQLKSQFAFIVAIAVIVHHCRRGRLFDQWPLPL